jgi:hypothetical protein
MGRYLILLYEDEASWNAVGQEETEAILAAHRRFGAAHPDVLRGGGWLHPTATATSVRGSGGGGNADAPGFAAGEDALVTDGPYVETKEALGGFYLVEVPDLDSALALAREVPAPFGGVEVRPLRET